MDTSIWNWQTILLSPVYLYQTKQVKRHTLRLAEPQGERKGRSPFFNHGVIDKASLEKAPLSILVLGDSAAAGVGVVDQSQALLGQLITALSNEPTLAHRYAAIDWQLAATTGHTSFDILRRLYTITGFPVDVVVISMGVNDVTSNTPMAEWQHYTQHIIAILQRKFQAKHIIFLGLPPMALMPALPTPLNTLIGKMAQRLDLALQQQITASEQQRHQSRQAKNDKTNGHLHYFSSDFLPDAMIDKPVCDNLFAKDGFHPSELAYQHLASSIVKYISQVLMPNS